MLSSIKAEIESTGVNIEIGQDFTITLVQGSRELLDAQINKLVEARAAARARKDFKESDRIRDELTALGVALKDGKDADGKPLTTWEIAR